MVEGNATDREHDKSQDTIVSETVKRVVTSLPVDHTGTTVYVKGWRQVADTNKNPIIIIHDLGEQTSYYRFLASQLISRGYSVYAFDQRGHGRSGRRLGHAPSFNVLVRDLLQVVAWVKHKENARRPILIGHGIGALVALDFINNYGTYCASAVLSAPTMELHHKVTWATRVVLKLLSEITPLARIPAKLNPGFARALQGELKGPEEHTSVYFPRITARFTLELLQAIERASKAFVRYEGDVLILCPGEDTICHYSTLRKKVATHDKDNIQLEELIGVGHQVFTEGDESRRKALSVLLPWLDAQTKIIPPRPKLGTNTPGDRDNETTQTPIETRTPH